jgi:hypothetical protein
LRVSGSLGPTSSRQIAKRVLMVIGLTNDVGRFGDERFTAR